MAVPAATFDFDKRLKEIDLFFEGRGKEHKTMRRLVQNLDKAGISYAIVGGMAVNAHGHERTTKDVDILLTADGFNAFRRRFVPKSYDAVEGHPRRFFDRRNRCMFDILVTGLYPGSGKPGPISYPDPGQVCEIVQEQRVVNLPTLLQLKLAARRHQDFGDVVNLIRVHDLDEKFLKKLHPSVHRDFIECLEEKRRNDEYEARQNRMLQQKLKEMDETEAKYRTRHGGADS